jgi:hypothetical protein
MLAPAISATAATVAISDFFISTSPLSVPLVAEFIGQSANVWRHNPFRFSGTFPLVPV